MLDNELKSWFYYPHFRNAMNSVNQWSEECTQWLGIEINCSFQPASKISTEVSAWIAAFMIWRF